MRAGNTNCWGGVAKDDVGGGSFVSSDSSR